MKKIILAIIIAVLGIAGYAIYLGLTKSENNNAGMIAMDAGNLAQSVTDTFKDGVNVLAEKTKEVAIEAKKEAVELADTAKDKAISAGSSAVEGIANATSDAAKSVVGSDK